MKNTKYQLDGYSNYKAGYNPNLQSFKYYDSFESIGLYIFIGVIAISFLFYFVSIVLILKALGIAILIFSVWVRTFGMSAMIK